MKKLNVIKKNFFSEVQFFYEIIPSHAILSTKEWISLIVTNHLWQISFFQTIWDDL